MTYEYLGLSKLNSRSPELKNATLSVRSTHCFYCICFCSKLEMPRSEKKKQGKSSVVTVNLSGENAG